MSPVRTATGLPPAMQGPCSHSALPAHEAGRPFQARTASPRPCRPPLQARPARLARRTLKDGRILLPSVLLLLLLQLRLAAAAGASYTLFLTPAGSFATVPTLPTSETRTIPARTLGAGRAERGQASCGWGGGQRRPLARRQAALRGGRGQATRRRRQRPAQALQNLRNQRTSRSRCRTSLGAAWPGCLHQARAAVTDPVSNNSQK